MFARCKELGLKLVAHAGEEGPPAYIGTRARPAAGRPHRSRQRCLEDPALIARLAPSSMTLTVCPLSNLKLCVFRPGGPPCADAGRGPDGDRQFGRPGLFRRLHERQLGPPTFDALPLELRSCDSNWRATALPAAFLDPARKQAYLAEVDAFFAASGVQDASGEE